MNITIQLLSVTKETKQSAKGTSYQQLEVAYKDLSNNGKVASKKIMDFSSKEVYNLLALAKPVEVFNIEMEKKGEYWTWVKATKGSASAPAQPVTAQASVTSSAPSKGNWESAEERAKKQVYIIRQSSLATAVTALQVGRKGEIKKEEIVELAKYLEDYVMGTTTDFSDNGTIETIPEDIPF